MITDDEVGGGCGVNFQIIQDVYVHVHGNSSSIGIGISFSHICSSFTFPFLLSTKLMSVILQDTFYQLAKTYVEES